MSFWLCKNVIINLSIVNCIKNLDGIVDNRNGATFIVSTRSFVRSRKILKCPLFLDPNLLGNKEGVCSSYKDLRNCVLYV